jgi:hypothetical protein
LSEFGTLERLSKNICPHVLGGAILQSYFTGIEIVLEKEVFGFDILVPLELDRPFF